VIASAEWDLVVQTLIELAQSTVQVEEEPVKPHDHPDQVSATWLDPKLRTLVEGGPLADPAQVARLGDAERRLDRVTSALEDVRTDVARIRDLVNEVAGHDLTREAAVTDLRRTVETVSNAREDVLALRGTLAALEDKVSVAVETGTALQVDGDIVHLQDVVNRISALEALRDRLTLPTGQLLDAAELQRQFAGLQNTFMTQGQLDDAIKKRPAVLSDDDRNKLQTDLRTDLMTQLTASNQQLADDINRSTNEKLAAVDAKVATAVSNSIPSVTASVTATITPKIDASVSQGVESAVAEAKKLIDYASGTLRTELDAGVSDLKLSITGIVDAELESQLPSQLKDITSRISSVETRIEPLEKTVSLQTTEISGLTTQTTTINKQLGTLDKRITTFGVPILETTISPITDVTRVPIQP
jgi:Skp family chaperone for outer membrane proteins